MTRDELDTLERLLDEYEAVERKNAGYRWLREDL